MINSLIFILVLLQIKHWYIDFVNQSMKEVNGKGIYGNIDGIKHSLKHGIGTFIALLLVTNWAYVPYILLIAVYDFVTHYHIDWTKMNYGNRDIQTPAFWNHLGLDQMAHQLVYLSIAYIVVG